MKDPWYKDYFDKQPKVTKDVYDTKHWESQYYKKSNSSWGGAWNKPPKNSSFYGGGESKSLRKKILIQGVISAVILMAVYVVFNNDNSFSERVRVGLSSFITANDYQPVITKMVRMGLEAENVDWPILNELRGNETVNESKGTTNKSETNKEEVKPDNSLEVNKDNSVADKKNTGNDKVSATIAQYTLPISGKVVKNFGWSEDKELNIKKFHEGIDIEGKVGTKVKSIGKGQVVAIGSNDELGNYILMELKDDITVLYGQLGKPKVKEGEEILEGEIISTLGASKEGKNIHLHLEMRRNGEGIDPLELLGIETEAGK